MKAMVLQAVAPIETAPLIYEENVPNPVPQQGELLVKITFCAICRTDLHVIEGDLPSRKLPLIPGHQIVGVVESVGKGCKRFKCGNRVGVAWVRHACDTCNFCDSGQENLCESSQFTGYHADGGYAEYTVIPEDFAYDIPRAFKDEQAAPLLCAGIIGYRALKRSALPHGGTLGIFGFGSSAHIIIQVAQFRSSRVFVVTRAESHQRLAEKMGAYWAGNDVSRIPEKLDSIISFAPAGELVPQALSILKKGGTLALAGIHLTDIPKLNYESHLFYEKNICSVTANTRLDGQELLATAAQIPIQPHTTVYPLADANRALCDLKKDQINGTGVIAIGG